MINPQQINPGSQSFIGNNHQVSELEAHYHQSAMAPWYSMADSAGPIFREHVTENTEYSANSLSPYSDTKDHFHQAALDTMTFNKIFSMRVEYQEGHFPSAGNLALTSVPERPTGPVQFIVKLLEWWCLSEDDAVSLLGFDQTDVSHVRAVLKGKDHFRGRDVRDRIAHVFQIRSTLMSLFRDIDVENKWLREPHSLLDGRSPMALLLAGSMEDILMVKEYADTVAGR